MRPSRTWPSIQQSQFQFSPSTPLPPFLPPFFFPRTQSPPNKNTRCVLLGGAPPDLTELNTSKWCREKFQQCNALSLSLSLFRVLGRTGKTRVINWINNMIPIPAFPFIRVTLASHFVTRSFSLTGPCPRDREEAGPVKRAIHVS